MGLRGTVGGFLVAVIVLAGAGPAAAHPDRLPAADAARPGGGVPRTVTLITGDRVVVAAGGAALARVEPGPGRAHVRFLSRRIAGHLQVVPADALPLLHTDRLDPRLFDVTALLAYGYDDTRAELPLIVTYPRGLAPATASIAGARLVRDLPAVNAAAVRQPRAGAAAFWADLVGRATPAARGQAAKVWLDARRRYTLDVSVPLIGAPAAHRAGFTGAGVTVAVLDTGLDAAHPDLADRIAGERNFTEGSEDDLDHVGHGTHVASTVAGSGAASGGRFAGVAPGATLLDGKVCVVDGCAESWILAGMQWAAAERHAKVVNMSLAGPDTPEADPVEQAVETLTARFGTLFVVAAGNAGADGTVGSPGTADAALSVGATTKADELAFFSSRGPRVGDSALKPDLTAPGVDITAARGKDGELGEPGERYMSLSGTSMATPHVAGSAAILAQRHPDWSPAALKAGLMAAAKPNPAIGVYAQGAGRVDIGRAVTQTVTADPPSVSFGRTTFPHTDDTPITRTVTYHNHGTANVTLDLALHTTAADGTPTAPGMFTLGADRVTIPAGRDATVRVTADTSVAGPTGFAGGTITGTARGGLVVQTPLAVDLEEESYDLTLAVTDRSGNATDRYSAMIFSVDRNVTYLPHDPDGTATVRLPKGRYLLYTNVFDGDEEDPDATQLVQPALDLTRTTTVAMDARLGQPVSVSVQRPSATPRLVQVGFAFGTPTASTGADMVVGGFDGLFTAQIGDRRQVDGFVSFVVSQWGDARAGRFSYGLAFTEPGRMFTGFRRRVADRELATVRLSLVAQASGSQGTRTTLGVLPGVGITVGAAFTYDLPARPTELYNTGGGLRWEMEFVEQATGPEPEPLGTLRAPPIALRAGRTTHQTWNAAVVGPAFPRPPAPELWATRTGDTISVSLPVFSDGAGHAGSGRVDSGRTTLSRDGVVVGSSSDVGFVFATVPAGEARYRLVTTAERGAPFLFSTRVRYAWTFRSGHVDGEAPRALPLSAIRFTPALDDHNTAPRGGTFPIPVSVDRHPDSSAGGNRTLTVEASFDDGATWRQARVVRGPDGIVALVRHPDHRGYVSLRARATDSDGNTVTETVIRAYRIA